jgi:hypothetical protein
MKILHPFFATKGLVEELHLAYFILIDNPAIELFIASIEASALLGDLVDDEVF